MTTVRQSSSRFTYPARSRAGAADMPRTCRCAWAARRPARYPSCLVAPGRKPLMDGHSIATMVWLWREPAFRPPRLDGRGLEAPRPPGFLTLHRTEFLLPFRRLHHESDQCCFPPDVIL